MICKSIERMLRGSRVMNILFITLMTAINLSYSVPIPNDLADKIKTIYCRYWIEVMKSKHNSTMGCNENGILEEKEQKIASEAAERAYKDIRDVAFKKGIKKVIEWIKDDLDTWIKLLTRKEGIIKCNPENRAELINLFSQQFADLDQYLHRHSQSKPAKS